MATMIYNTFDLQSTGGNWYTIRSAVSHSRSDSQVAFSLYNRTDIATCSEVKIELQRYYTPNPGIPPDWGTIGTRYHEICDGMVNPNKNRIDDAFINVRKGSELMRVKYTFLTNVTPATSVQYSSTFRNQ